MIILITKKGFIMSNLKEAFAHKDEPSANKRLMVISPIISMPNDTSKQQKERMKKIKTIAADVDVSVKTIKRWLRQYDKDGIKGLEPQYPKVRSDTRLYIKYDNLLKEAKAMRVQTPTISVTNIISCLESRHPNILNILKRSTLQRHLANAGYSRRTLLAELERDGRGFFGRYRKEHRMIQIQGDVKEPPRGVCVDSNGLPVTPYVQLWMDNHSRKILSWKVDIHASEDLALAPLRTLIEKYGIPDSILTDQGTIYRGRSINHCTHILNIEHKRSRPYRPQSKGALERLNGTLDDLFIPIKELNNVKIEMFTQLVAQRIDEYNNTKHSALTVTGENGEKLHLTPNETFDRDNRTVRLATPEIIDMAFNITEYRRVSKDGLISFRGKCYRLKNGYAKPCERVMIKYCITDSSAALIVKNSQEIINAGGSEFSAYSLEQFVIKPNVAYDDVMKKTISEEKQSFMDNPPDFPAQVERVLRELCRSNGTYVDEKYFMENQLPNLLRNITSGGMNEINSAYAQEISGTVQAPASDSESSVSVPRSSASDITDTVVTITPANNNNISSNGIAEDSKGSVSAENVVLPVETNLSLYGKSLED